MLDKKEYKQKNKKENKNITNKDIKNKIYKSIIKIVMIFIFIYIISLFIYALLNKKSGIDNIFQSIIKKNDDKILTEKGIELRSKKYISTVYNKKVDNFSIKHEEGKFYFTSNIADIVFDEVKGRTHFDLLTTRIYNSEESTIEKEENIIEKNEDKIESAIYIKKETLKNVEVNTDDIKEEKNNVDLEQNDNDKDIVNVNQTIKKEIPVINERVYIKELPVCIKYRNGGEECEELNPEIRKYLNKQNETKDKENLENLQDYIFYNEDEVFKLQIPYITIVDEYINMFDKEAVKDKIESSKDSSLVFVNHINLKGSVIYGFIDSDEKRILVENDNKLYIYTAVDYEIYKEQIEAKIEKINIKASNLMSKLFTDEYFSTYIKFEKPAFKSKNNVTITFFNTYNTVINKTERIDFVFNIKNEEILEIKVSGLPFENYEVKVNRYEAIEKAKEYLSITNKNLKIDELTLESIKLEIDSVKTIKKEIAEVKSEDDENVELEASIPDNNVEKMWKVKFKEYDKKIIINSKEGKIESVINM